MSKDTLYEAMAHLEDAFVVFTEPLDSPSTAKRSANPRKAYPIDTGLAAAHSFSTAKNVGHLLESIGYLPGSPSTSQTTTSRPATRRRNGGLMPGTTR